MKSKASPASPAGRQRGAVLVISLILLVIISLVVASAYTLSTLNVRSVGNVQYRAEAVTAANTAIESVVTTTFLNALNTTTNVDVDLNKDGATDYSVAVKIPQCPTRVKKVGQETPSGYETTGGEASANSSFVSDWELEARVSDAATGSNAVVHEGVRIPIDEVSYQTKVLSCGLTVE